ncbi:MAG: preprotein translocase subunit SecY [Planctomycetes bacterium]|nr:preprotein translocase subunit SecY [Planctomycetota bacterium]
MWKTVRNIWVIPELRSKLLATLGFLFVYRVGFMVPIPGINTRVLAEMETSQETGQLLGLIDLVSGGSLMRCSVFSLGIMPYISASIIFSLLVKVLPKLEELSKEGEAGRRKIGQYTRYTAVLLCFFQSFFTINLIVAQKVGDDPRYQRSLYYESLGSFWFTAIAVLSLTMGTMFLVWLGEQITEYGIGNGASVIIMAGIVARMPQSVFHMVASGSQDDASGSSDALFKLVVFLILFAFIVALVVLIHLGQRRIPIQNPKISRGRRVYAGDRSAIPLRVNHAGVMPVIFASSLMIFPPMIFSQFADWSQGVAWLGSVFSSAHASLLPGSLVYTLVYMVSVFFFAFFWNQLVFNPDEMSRQLKEYGAFIPGVRPGRKTAEYLKNIMVRITLVGAIFLCFIALFPHTVADWMQMDFSLASFLGGTSLLILVGVALDVVQKVESHLVVRNYDGFGEGGAARARGARNR